MTRCSASCSEVGEPLAGSAGEVAAWIGIAWPKPLWHPEEAIDSQGLPGALREVVQACEKKLALRLFQRDARAPADRPEVVLWRPRAAGGRRSAVPLAELGPLVASFLDGAALDLEPLEPELFVCTDGKHDLCCAQLGRPVYEALRAASAAQPRAPRVAECSHLGGHRFAANCLSLPDGHLYGRLVPADAAALLAAIASGEPLLSRLRGALTGDPVEAAAGVFLVQKCGALEWRTDGPSERAGDELRVPARMRTTEGEQRVIVRCSSRTYSGPTSCDAEAVETRRWVATSVERG